MAVATELEAMRIFMEFRHAKECGCSHPSRSAAGVCVRPSIVLMGIGPGVGTCDVHTMMKAIVLVKICVCY